jgi:hypothetical protein
MDVNELLKWWNQYVSYTLSLECDVLISPFLSSENFPSMLTNGSTAASHNATQSSLKMLKDACVRHALCSTLGR